MRVTKPLDLISSKNNKKKTIKQKINVPSSNPTLKNNNPSLAKKYKKITKEPPKENTFIEAQTKKHIDNVTNIPKYYNQSTKNLNAPPISNQNGTQSRNNAEKNYTSRILSSNEKNNNSPEHLFNLHQNISVSTKNIFPSYEYMKKADNKYQKNTNPHHTISNEPKKFRNMKTSSMEHRYKKTNDDFLEDFNYISDNNNKASDFFNENNNENLSYGSPNYYNQYPSYMDDRKISGIDKIKENNFKYFDRSFDRNDLYSNRNRKATIELNQDNTLIFFDDRDKINDYENYRNSEIMDNSYNNYYYSKMFPTKNKKLSNYNINKNRLFNKNPIGGFGIYNNEFDSDYNNNINNSMHNQTTNSFFGHRIIPPNINYQKNRRNYFYDNDIGTNSKKLNKRLCNYSPRLGGPHYHSMIEEGDMKLSPMKNYMNTNDNINRAMMKKNKIRILKSNKPIQEFDINLSDEGQDEINNHNNIYNNNYFYSKDIIPMINNQYNINSNKNIIINNKKIRGNGGHSMQKRNNTNTIQNKTPTPIRPLVQSSSVTNNNREKQSPKLNNRINNSGIFDESKIFIKKIPKNEIPFPDKKKQSCVNLKINHNMNKIILTTLSKDTKDSKDNISKDNINEKHNFSFISPCQCNSFNLLTETKDKTIENEKSEKLLFNNENDVVDYVYNKFDEERKKKNYFNKKLRFTGFVLTKKLKGKNIFDIRIEDDLEKINKQLKDEGVTVNNKQVELRYVGDKKNEKNNEKKNDNKNNLKDKNSEDCSKLKKENEMLIKKDEIKNELIKKLDKEKVNLLEEIKKLNKQIEVQKIINNKLMLEKNDSYIFQKSKLKENTGEKLEIIAEKSINTEYFNNYKMNASENGQKENQKMQSETQEPSLNYKEQGTQKIMQEKQDATPKINPETKQQEENNSFIIEQNLIQNEEKSEIKELNENVNNNGE